MPFTAMSQKSGKLLASGPAKFPGSWPRSIATNTRASSETA